MATEATYLVLADQGITTSTGLHQRASTVWLSDLDDAEGRLERLGMILPTGERSKPPAGRTRDGNPGWIDAAYFTGQDTIEAKALDALAELPEGRQAALGDAPVSAPDDAALNDAIAASPAAEAAGPIAADADGAAVVALPVPAVIRFVKAHPDRAGDVLRAEQRRAKTRASVVAAVKEIARRPTADAGKKGN
jgi:hypothetical protein